MIATKLIEYIEKNKFVLKRLQLISISAEQLRSTLRYIYKALIDDAPEIAGILRLAGLRFNTSPELPKVDLLKSCGLNSYDHIKKKWGEDVAKQCCIFEQTLQRQKKQGSLLEWQLVKVIKDEIQVYGLEQVKIWCHPRECSIYKDLLTANNVELKDENFICSLPDYRSTDFFEVLIFVGPLRDFGWSGLPRIVLNTPRYRKMVQLVWRGLADNLECGYDPVVPKRDYLSTLFEQDELVITEQEIPTDTVPSIDSILTETIDDFGFYKDISNTIPDAVECLLVELDLNSGVLLASNAHPLVLDTNETTYPFRKIRTKYIDTGHFLLLPDVDVDLGDGSKTQFPLATRWKKALENMYHFHWVVLMGKMRNAGINLKCLDAAAYSWKHNNGDAIHAPQSRDHFRKLIENVLPENCLEGRSWQQAWKEIECARTRARQDGRVAADILNEELIRQLNENSDSFICDIGQKNIFNYQIDKDSSLKGSMTFYRVMNVSNGFCAPRELLGVVKRIDELELYRSEF